MPVHPGLHQLIALTSQTILLNYLCPYSGSVDGYFRLAKNGAQHGEQTFLARQFLSYSYPVPMVLSINDALAAGREMMC